jgi:DNA-binding transcriptional LysR family regulator
MELRQLEHFVVIAEERNFTRAAARLSISQSGLSASIRALERELGAVLFLRNTRSVRLNEVGRALLVEARRTLASATAARDAVAAVKGVLRGSLAVGLEQCLGVVDVFGLLVQFRSLHPAVELSMRQVGSARLLDELAEHRLDVAFVATGGQPVEGIELRCLSTEEMVLVCHPEHRLAHAGPVTLEELSGESFVDFSTEWGARVISDRAFARAGVAHRVTLEVNDVHALLALVSYGLGVALVPERIAAKPGFQHLVVAVEDEIDKCQVSVALPAGAEHNPAAEELVRLLPDSDDWTMPSPQQAVLAEARP